MLKRDSTTVLIAAGGTGGHIAPALAVASLMQDKGLTIKWIGSGSSGAMESRFLASKKIPRYAINAGALRNIGLHQKLLAPWMLLLALWQSIGIIIKNKPIGVLGMGSYVSGPVCVAAWLLGVPVVLHEQNRKIGLSNRLSLFFSRLILCACAETIHHPKARVVANPVAQKFFNLPTPDERSAKHSNLLHILVLGGSQGSVELNYAVASALSLGVSDGLWKIMHQCGDGHLDEVRGLYAESLAVVEGVQIEPFIDDMVTAYSWADIVVCRAGASTLAELAAVGLPAVLVPLRYLAGDHQRFNAEDRVREKAAVSLSLESISSGSLVSLLQTWILDRMALLTMARASYALRRPESADKMVNYCLGVFNA